MALLQIAHLSKTFPGVRALDSVSLAVEAGEIHAVCGENGAGKSTLLKILSGIYPTGSYQGSILWQGRPLVLKGPRNAEEQGIVLVAQELNLVPALSLAENLFLGRERLDGWRMDWGKTYAEAREALSRVGIEEDPRTPAEALNVGKQQLVEIARALHQKARLLILDEPTAALTEADANRLLSLVEEIASQGTAVLYVSHRLEEVFRIAKDISVFRDGKSIKTAPKSEWTRDSVVAAMVGRDVDEAKPALPQARDHSALEVRNWQVSRPSTPGRMALEPLSFSVKSGEILGLGGLMGSGRSALLSTLFGDWRAAGSGELKLGEGAWKPGFQTPQQAMSEGVCLASEDRKKLSLVGTASVEENLALACFEHFASGGQFKLDWAAIRKAAEEQQAAMAIKAPSLEAEIFTLSGGNQQKVVLGRLLMLKPKVLLLDEPTRGIDIGAKAEIHRLIRSLAAQGMAVVVASSDLPELLALSHRILVLSQGRLSGEVPGATATAESVMHLATTI